jgi:lysophospholipase
MPEGGHAFWFKTGDAPRLRGMVWPPAMEVGVSPRGTVFIFPGRTEFAEKYFEVVAELMARGFGVAIVDWRGQGLSDRALEDIRKGHVSDFSEFDADFNAFMNTVSPSMPKPWIGLAHSMGGNVLMRALHDHSGLFAACVFSAPMLGLKLGNIAMRALVATIVSAGNALGFSARYVPGATPASNDEVPFAQNILTHDPARYAHCQAFTRVEPKLALGGATYGWVAAAQASIRRVMQVDYLQSIETPVLIALAGGDLLIDPASLRFAATHLPQGEIIEIAGAFHEILIETDAVRAQFWTAFDRFTERYAPSNRS